MVLSLVKLTLLKCQFKFPECQFKLEIGYL